MLGMIFKRTHRDWHTESAHEDLPQATSGISSQGTTHTQGVILGQAKRDPKISVGTPEGLAIDPLATNDRDSRHEAGNDPVVLASPAEWKRTPLVRVPGEGQGPVLCLAQTHTRPSALTRADQTPACAGDAAERAVQVIA